MNVFNRFFLLLLFRLQLNYMPMSACALYTLELILPFVNDHRLLYGTYLLYGRYAILNMEKKWNDREKCKKLLNYCFIITSQRKKIDMKHESWGICNGSWTQTNDFIEWINPNEITQNRCYTKTFIQEIKWHENWTIQSASNEDGSS